MRYLASLFFAVGIVIAGCECESRLWPWMNLAGVACMGLSAMIACWAAPHEWKEE